MEVIRLPWVSQQKVTPLESNHSTVIAELKPDDASSSSTTTDQICQSGGSAS